jgi:single-strand DNA-binding protein
VAFGKLAEYAKTLIKGTHVMVQGSVRSREYEKDGVSRRVSEVRAETIAKLDGVQRGVAREVPES